MKRLELGDNVAISTSYNLQGWIDAIECSMSSSLGDGLVLSEDVFNEQLSYYDPADDNSTPRYSGKISEQRWAHGSIINGFNGFAYTYDSMGRLTDARTFMSSTSQNKPLIGTTREQIAYDKNCNVVQLSDTRGTSSTTTRNYAVQGNQVIQLSVNGNNLGYPTYDERGNMTQNVEAGLQMSYNLCNLPKQITAEDGTLVNYTYFADGTKFKAVDATGNGFVYTGSLRWSVEDGVLTPESIAITGGRAVFADNSWATNYYITDHLGSVRAVTDAEGEVLDTFDYMPYGSEISSTSSTTTDYRFTGKELQSKVNNSIYDSFARFQNTYGRFMSIDPKAESFYNISPYTYCAGDPVNLVDPDGEKIKVIANDEIHFWREYNGEWGFYNNDNELYIGDDEFANAASAALTHLMKYSPTGFELVEYLSNHISEIQLLNTPKSGWHKGNLGWNINNPEAVPTTEGLQANAIVNLGHELAHAQYEFTGGEKGTWFQYTNKKVK